MLHVLLTVPAGVSVGLTTASLGLVRAFDRQGVNVGFYKPISQPRPGYKGPDLSTTMMLATGGITPSEPIDMDYAQRLLSQGRKDDLMEEVVARFQPMAELCEVIIVEGLVRTPSQPEAVRFNLAIAEALNAEVVLVATPGNMDERQFEDQLVGVARMYGGIHHDRIAGCIVNKVGAPLDERGHISTDLSAGSPVIKPVIANIEHDVSLFRSKQLKVLGLVPWDQELIAPRVYDICKYLRARYISRGKTLDRRVYSVTLCGRSMINMINGLVPGRLIITSGDRADIIVATCMAALKGIQISGLLLTGGFAPSSSLLEFCNQAIESGLPIMITDDDNYRTTLKLHDYHYEVPLDDIDRIEDVKDHTARYINKEWLSQFKDSDFQVRLSPAAFRYHLIKNARAANKSIVLPEGEEPRTIEAAIICHEKGIARCVLLGDPEKIRRTVENRGLELPVDIEVIPPKSIIGRYIEPLAEKRKHKGLTHGKSKDLLQDPIVLGTMMLEMGDVDGLVSGALNTTANTIRPALQIIKTAPGVQLVSSIFFMCLPEQVLVYGDCAVNTDPNAEQLADIAIQSADSATAFGINPKVAMISYSTGQSGTGTDVEKVREATKIARTKRPDLIIDGPMQYDAALNKDVAKSKAPDSPVAGQATVIVFPDLNTGNTTYKAVQRSADVVSIGPMLQGLNKPVNDLSRGALVEDIVFTIALTAIQAATRISLQDAGERCRMIDYKHLSIEKLGVFPGESKSPFKNS